MEALLRYQEDISERIVKAQRNYKKSPRDRLTRPHIQVRLNTIDELWQQFNKTHESLVKESDAKLFKSSTYYVKNVYDETEECYVEYKSELLILLEGFKSEMSNAKERCNTSSTNVKLPKIRIPTFSGLYTEWVTFRDLFTSLVHNCDSLDNVQKMHYLKGYLSGEAEQLLRQLAISADNYQIAWETIKSRYDNKKYLTTNILKRLFSLRSATCESAQYLKKIVDTTNDCLNGLSNLGVNVKDWDVILIYMLSLKLDQESRRQWEFYSNNNSSSDVLSTFDEFKNFLLDRARGLEAIETNKSNSYVVNNNNKIENISKPQFVRRAFHVVAVKCVYCTGEHALSNCSKFANQSSEFRRSFVRENNMCFICMGNNHSARFCKKYIKCDTCRRRHHTLLHPVGLCTATNSTKGLVPSNSSTSTESPSTVGTPGQVVSCVSVRKSYDQILLATALVHARSDWGNYYTLRALLDQGSQASFVTEAAVQLLKLKRVPINGNVVGIGNHKELIKAQVTLQIQSKIDPTYIVMVKAYVLRNITGLLPSRVLPPQEFVNIMQLNLADPGYNVPNKIDILFGAEVYSQVLREGIRRDLNGSTVAQSTALGWILSGGVVNDSASCLNDIVTFHSHNDENDSLKRFWELEADIVVQDPKQNYTEEENKCEDSFACTTRRDSTGRYIVKLPFRDEDPSCKYGNSLAVALRRFVQLERKFSKNPEMKNRYSDVINEYLELGHMEVVPEEQVNKSDAVYLPHHAVIREDKTTSKLRVVFDASCPGTNGASLNQDLLVGPALQPPLRQAILRWRCNPICLVADIVKMYRQVKVHNSDVDFQRIVWRETPEEDLRHFRLLRVTFGTASAPYLAVRALQQVAYDEAKQSPAIADRILKHFYVDDLLTGCETVQEGKQIYDELNEILHRGGFELQKWSSNNKELLHHINGNFKEIDGGLQLKTDEIIKILGLVWNRETDNFGYIVNLPSLQTHVTKRNVISDISRLFDPLGWLAPVIIRAKIFIQKLWCSGIDWDEKVPPKLLKDWLSFRESLKTLSNFQIPRWNYAISNTTLELQGFCDASNDAYAAVVYLRAINMKDNVHVSLIASKTKVAPIKQISIPRLELCGAVLLTRLLLEVSNVMNIDKNNIYAWTDSSVVLSWLNGRPNRWKTFVANRVSEIITSIEPGRWSHIQSKLNPADCASRGIQPAELVNNKFWLNGPEILMMKNIKYNRLRDVKTNLEEIKVNLVTTTNTEDIIWGKFSSLSKLVRVVAYMRRVLSWKKNTNKKKEFLAGEELRDAMNLCIKKCQIENFTDEINILTGAKKGKLKGPLKPLNPFIDNVGILRVGGRLERANLGEEQKHPILLPKKADLSNLLVSDAHTKTLHGGPQLMLVYLRSKYWILGAKNLTKVYVRNCVRCIRYSTKPTTPLMGQLPSCRVTPSRPFTNSGVDFTGPIYIRTSKGRGHHSCKGYICLFVCMATKAIHIEVVSDLTTQGFLAAFKRFISRRGNCSNIWSDNGTNFVGAAKELNKLFYAERSHFHKELAGTLAANGTKWHFIPPYSPNFGGLWEAGVKAVKFHLRRVIGDITLTYEELSTVLIQVEACLNSRPISRIANDSEGFDVLTPGHFLVGEPLLTAPDYNFELPNISSLRRWQLTQRIMQSFWRRWSQEYLTSFLHRYKWALQSPEPNVGELVLVKEEHLPPSRWLLGRIVAKHPGSDGVTRVVSLRTRASVIKRPVSKICVLPISNIDS